MSEDARLERIEKKMDEIGAAIVSLARMEERMRTVLKRMDALDIEHTAQSRKLSKLEGTVGLNGQSLRFAERIFWITATGAIAFAFNYYRASL
tara:strand:+ start:89 stop:367 length:279 start_codon:yes stop_codon:yes gene_type:complete